MRHEAETQVGRVVKGGAEGARGNPRRSGSPGSQALALCRSIELSAGGLVVRLDPDEVQQACVNAGWSLAKLGKTAGISRPTLSKAVSGAPIRPRTAWLIRRVLGVSGIAVEA